MENIQLRSKPPGTGGEDELHYAGGIWSSSTANYFVDAVPLLHFDSKYVDGATANDESALDGKFLNDNTTTASTETVWKSRQGNYAMYNHSSNPNNQVVYNSSRGGFHARDFAPNGAVSNARLIVGTDSGNTSGVSVFAKSFTYFMVISSNSSERQFAIPTHAQSATSSMIAGMANTHNKLGGEGQILGSPYQTNPEDDGSPMIIIVRGYTNSIDGWVFGSKDVTIGGSGGRMLGANHVATGQGRNLPYEEIGYTNSGTYWNGVYHEMILYSTALTSAQTNKITQFM